MYLIYICRETAVDSIGVHDKLDYYEKVCGGGATNPWNITEAEQLWHVSGHLIYEGNIYMCI